MGTAGPCLVKCVNWVLTNIQTSTFHTLQFFSNQSSVVGLSSRTEAVAHRLYVLGLERWA